MKMHRGRLIDHLQIIVDDIEAARTFYTAIFETLAIPIGESEADHLWADEIYISTADSPAAAGEVTGRMHIALQAQSPDMVEAFHAAGLKAGGKDNGAPGERPYHPGYYAAFLLDPAGNNLEAVYHGPHKRSADSVQLEFEMPSG